MDYAHLIDSRNKELYDKLLNEDKIQINIIDGQSEPCWSVKYNSFSKIADIYPGAKLNDICAFTHELLHVVQEIQGQSLFKVLVAITFNPSQIASVFTEYELAEKVNNTILHVRMLPEYTKMGFPKHEFISNYYDRYSEAFFNEHFFELINANNLVRNNLNAFLTLYITSRLHPNSEIRDYHLGQIDSKYSRYNNLLVRLNSLCSDWETHKIDMNSDFFNQLIIQISDWHKDYLN